MVKEQTKVCTLCQECKPWSTFHAKVKWEDGTMRQPQSRCKPCQAAAAKPNRKRYRSYDKTYYWRIRNDPAAYADRLEVQRFHYRGRHGVTHIGKREPDSELLPVEPFAEWLRTLGDTDTARGRECGLGPRTVYAYRHRERGGVSIDVVDRACIEAGAQLADLYPLEAAA